MVKNLIKIIKIFITVVIFLITLAGLFFLSVFTDRQKIEKTEDINIRYTQKPPYLLTAKPSYTAITWDIGFATQGAGVDSYFEGGKTSCPPYDSVMQWMSEIENYLTSVNNTDFVLLQEIDRLSKRSYNIDQRHVIDSVFLQHARCFAGNHNVSFIPVPLRHPYGAISAGMETLSATYPLESMRYAFEKKGNFFKKPFMEDLCCINNYYRLRNGKSLIIINVYNAPLKKMTERLNLAQSIVALMVTEYEQGNYVMAGGNWGITPLTATDAAFAIPDTTFFNNDNTSLSEILPDGWKLCFDPNHPTTRNMKTPYQQNTTPVSITDFFIVSPNVNVIETQTIPLNFKDSPHNPVMMKFSFNP